MSINVVIYVAIGIVVMGYGHRRTTVTGGFGGKNFVHCI